ncbi:MAG: low molecular weight phosphotyrosine protein phosphatase [Planctomycetota bacterium]|nr:low molecular weight phosphotyrosine protein phosphatase [Planctomycetota bacterium]
MTKNVGVLFVCLGNICRSPTADGIFRHLVKAAQLGDQIRTDSCGTINTHAGESPDSRTQAHAKEHGYDLSMLRGRQFKKSDFEEFNYILCMDYENLANIKALEPLESEAILQLFGEYCDHDGTPLAVPDPYYGGPDGFANVLQMVETGCRRLLAKVREDHGL